MEILAVWLFFAALVGYAASTKGHSGIGWFLIAVLISPLLAGIIVLLIKGKGTPATAAVARPVIGVADELTKLAALRDAGSLSPAEFDRQREMLLQTAPVPSQIAAPAQWTPEPAKTETNARYLIPLIAVVVLLAVWYAIERS